MIKFVIILFIASSCISAAIHRRELKQRERMIRAAVKTPQEPVDPKLVQGWVNIMLVLSGIMIQIIPNK